MSVNFTEDQKRRLITLYNVNSASDVQYETLLSKYIYFLEKYLASSTEEFQNPDYLFSLNHGFYWLLQDTLVDDKTQTVPVMDDIQGVRWKINNGKYNSLTNYEKLLYLLTQLQDRTNQLSSVREDSRLNLSEMSYLVECVYQTEQKMEMPKQGVMG